MSCKMVGAFIASLGVVTLVLAPGETFARSGTAPGARSAAPAISHPPFARPHYRGARGFFPGAGGYFYGANGEPIVDATQAPSGEINHKYTYTYDVPWDWAHRYPPNVVPSDRAYITECPTQTVTVPGNGGREHTVNVTRCY